MKLKPIFRGKLVTKKQLKAKIDWLVNANKIQDEYIDELLNENDTKNKMYEKEKKKFIKKINELQNTIDELQKKVAIEEKKNDKKEKAMQ